MILCRHVVLNIVYLLSVIKWEMSKKSFIQQAYVQLQFAFQLQVALLYFGSFFCGGSIISPTCVVTAAHCVVGYVCKGLYLCEAAWDLPITVQYYCIEVVCKCFTLSRQCKILGKCNMLCFARTQQIWLNVVKNWY